MISLIKSDQNKIEIEKNIMNSNPYFNFISIGREELTDDDLRKDHLEDKQINKERYLVTYHDKHVGILEYTMYNPNDHAPWLGLLVIDKKYQNLGLGQLVYQEYEQEMIKRKATEIRLGCLVKNTEGFKFWSKQGFATYKEILFDEKPLYCLKKHLGNK
ncbi:GNAT family N-acetyltransferase [Fredinandcohnia sp. 179-A 10B2 NHS]|uniref:GNAT family N-acetyltransferase n=1 Tax=Fredinandcohnia sp. 179-A 10B2 NHS TaxID=3235176 RepID=UPI0039A1CE5B